MQKTVFDSNVVSPLSALAASILLGCIFWLFLLLVALIAPSPPITNSSDFLLPLIGLTWVTGAPTGMLLLPVIFFCSKSRRTSRVRLWKSTLNVTIVLSIASFVLLLALACTREKLAESHLLGGLPLAVAAISFLYRRGLNRVLPGSAVCLCGYNYGGCVCDRCPQCGSAAEFE